MKKIIASCLTLAITSFSCISPMTSSAEDYFQKKEEITIEENKGAFKLTNQELRQFLEAGYAAYYAQNSPTYHSVEEVTEDNIEDFLQVYATIDEPFDYYFIDAYWDSTPSLAIDPTNALKGQNYPNPNIWLAHVSHAFDLIYIEFSDDSLWDNTESMYCQFHCHALGYGVIDDVGTWNLEPFRTETNLAVVIANKCNA